MWWVRALKTRSSTVLYTWLLGLSETGDYTEPLRHIQELGAVAASNQFRDAPDDFGNSNRTIEHRIDRKRRGEGSRGDQNRRDPFNQGLESRIAYDFRDCFDHQGRRHLARGQGLTGLVNRVHTESIDCLFAELGAHAGAQHPIASDDKDGGHGQERA